MGNRILLFFAFIFLGNIAFAQNAIIEGYAFETDNRGFLREVKITVYSSSNAIKAETGTNADGFFSVEVPAGQAYRIKGTKDIFEAKEVNLLASEVKAGEKAYVKLEMKRKPGYLFDVTLAESVWGKNDGYNAIDSALIEIYNNTQEKEELVLENHMDPAFEFTFEQGNHYTIMIRRRGFFTKRMEAFVNVDGCILCFEGIGNVRPNVSDNLTEGNTMGSLLANVELERIRLDRAMKIENIYYDYNKWDIRPDAAVELDKVIVMMKANPTLIVELGSHTDSRGRDEYNRELSQKRAQSAVSYIMNQGGIPATRIKARGYGETEIINRCTNGVECSDPEHEQNRRTEIKVIGYTDDDPYEGKYLREIIFDEKLSNFSWDDSEVIEVQEGDKLPPDAKPYTPPSTPVEKPVYEEPKVQPETPNTGGGSASLRGENTGAFGEEVVEEVVEIVEEDVVEAAPTTESTSSMYKAKQIPTGFSGHMIQFFTSSVELSEDHSIFRQYGNVKMDKLSNGDYAYFIAGFDSEKDALSFLEKVLSPRFPTAKIAEFSDGKRIR